MINPLLIPAEGIVYSKVEGEVVLIKIDNGKCFGMNKIGSAIWSEVTRHATASEISSRVLARCNNQFTHSPDEVTAEIHSYIQLLITEDLIQAKLDAPT
jgi:hypothetical protein